MVNWKKKVAVGLVALSAVIVPATVYASAYSITYDFDSNLTGQTRTFDGKNHLAYEEGPDPMGVPSYHLAYEEGTDPIGSPIRS
jgi:hypothetical protein